MKRYEIENTTSINNIKTVYNELVKSMDGLGYTNLLRNNYFKTKLRNDDAGTSDVIISKWLDNSLVGGSEEVFDGTEVTGSAFLYLDSTNNEDIFGIATDNEIYQEIQFNDIERLMQNGVLNLKLYFIKKTDDTDDCTITLEKTDDTTDWGTTTTLNSYVIDSESVVIGGEYTDTEDYYYTGNSNFVLVQYNISYNLLDDTTFRYTETNNIKYRILISNPAGSSTKYLMNAVAYFGNSDAGAFVKNTDDNSGNINYDEEIGEYYLTNDGQDRVYLSANKYFITVGDRGTYQTIYEAIETLDDDESVWGNSRIIYVTSDVNLGGNVSLVKGIRIEGNGYQIDCEGYKLSINVDNVTINSVDFTGTGNTGTILEIGTTATANYTTIQNCTFTFTGTVGTNPLINCGSSGTAYMNYAQFIKCSITGNYYHPTLVKINQCKHNDVYFDYFAKYGNDSTLVTGIGIYLLGGTNQNTQFNNIKINYMSLTGATAYSETSLVGIDVGDYCSYNNIEVMQFNEATA